ncbi:hypothetical protein BJF78_09025 [Pseudonocardia sp. CNS-139]|nr:hypothetical protein BJF78_09025 [Pseudonocardia sp. CNS-139]
MLSRISIRTGAAASRVSPSTAALTLNAPSATNTPSIRTGSVATSPDGTSTVSPEGPLPRLLIQTRSRSESRSAVSREPPAVVIVIRCVPISRRSTAPLSAAISAGVRLRAWVSRSAVAFMARTWRARPAG